MIDAHSDGQHERYDVCIRAVSAGVYGDPELAHWLIAYVDAPYCIWKNQASGPQKKSMDTTLYTGNVCLKPHIMEQAEYYRREPGICRCMSTVGTTVSGNN